jgi:hypothetical protein
VSSLTVSADFAANNAQVAHLVALDSLCSSTFSQVDTDVKTIVWKTIARFIWRRGDQPPTAIICKVAGDTPVSIDVRALIVESNTVMGMTTFTAAIDVGSVLTASCCDKTTLIVEPKTTSGRWVWYGAPNAFYG